MPIDINRPQSALLRGVRITEFNGHIINPDPVVLQETDFLLDEFLSPTKLKALTGMDDLALVDHLEMIVDTSETSLGNFGIYLPLLRQLKLNSSHVPRIRDLGTSLINLKVLWLSRSSLVDLDGIPTLRNLEELYLAFNEITDLSPCSMLDNLKCLDLEGNLIDDIKQIEFLNLCSNLNNLTLYGNPICSKPTPDAIDNDESYSYRHELIKLLPDLKILDDELTLNTNITPVIKNSKLPELLPSQHECPFDDDWQLINQFIEEGIGPSEDKLAISESLRPGTSSSRGSERISTGVRPLSSMRPLSSYRIKTASNRAALSSSTDFSGQQQHQQQQEDISNDSSDLTVGPALQGNPMKALMARKRTPNQEKAAESLRLRTPGASTSYEAAMRQLNTPGPLDKTEASSSTDNKYSSNNQLHTEVSQWKQEHARKLTERKEYFEPQVLRIDDDPSPAPPSDTELESDEDSYLPDKSSDKHTNFHTERSKTAFKQSFDYEVRLDAEGEISPRLSPSPQMIRVKNSGRFHKNTDSDLRLATGDTGYESLSSASLSSYMNEQFGEDRPRTGSPSYSLAPVRLPSSHKPKIVTTTTILPTTNVGILKKSIKSNLKPLPGIKPPKN